VARNFLTSDIFLSCHGSIQFFSTTSHFEPIFSLFATNIPSFVRCFCGALLSDYLSTTTFDPSCHFTGRICSNMKMRCSQVVLFANQSKKILISIEVFSYFRFFSKT